VSHNGELVNVTGSAGGGSSPDWSPDGTRLTYVSGAPGRDIYVIGVDGTGRRNLTETRNADELEPDWSPDGSRIVFSVQACADQGDPQPERVCSGLSTLSTVDTTGRIQPLIESPTVVASDREPDWSPSGDRIVFSSDRPVGGRPLGTERTLFTVGLDGAEPVPLPGGVVPGAHDPSYSPDGTLVAFEAGGGPGGTAAVYIADIEAGTPARVLELPVGAGAPAWSPDGTRVAFAWELSDLGRIYTVSVVR
jgi:TolB protein